MFPSSSVLLLFCSDKTRLEQQFSKFIPSLARMSIDVLLNDTEAPFGGASF